MDKKHAKKAFAQAPLARCLGGLHRRTSERFKEDFSSISTRSSYRTPGGWDRAWCGWLLFDNPGCWRADLPTVSPVIVDSTTGVCLLIHANTKILQGPSWQATVSGTCLTGPWAAKAKKPLVVKRMMQLSSTQRSQESTKGNAHQLITCTISLQIYIIYSICINACAHIMHISTIFYQISTTH